MERLRAFFDADSCLRISKDAANGDPQLRRVVRGNPEASCRPEDVSPVLVSQLLPPPGDHAIIYSSRSFLHPFTIHHESGLTGERRPGNRQAAQALASILDTRSFISIPLHGRGKFEGRIYLTSRRHVFRPQDIEFLRQAMDLVNPVLDNIRLVDCMASTAAEEERKRIARDIHDSIIQPYIGLKLGLTSVREKLATGAPETNGNADRLQELVGASAERIQRLIEMTDKGIDDLRGFVRNLKDSESQEGNLLASVRRFSSRFSEATGIATEVEADCPIRINDRLAAEVFQIVAEGLSNARRHTQSVLVRIPLSCSSEKLFLRIENDGHGGGQARDFMPHSIAERAEALQGRVRVEHPGNSGAEVIVEIPL
jgi:signal transduction histidine kinase